jgi:16S rRNA C967 or C1407 C5-methylase (RsmB/RsmF family)
MSAALLSEVFADFCESYTHLDSLLSRVPVAQKSKIATLLGTFLRRPLTTANKFKIELVPGNNAIEFWALGFLKLKKSKAVHELFAAMWEGKAVLPQDGSVIDFPPSLIEAFVKDWGQETAEQMARLLSQDPLTTIRLHRRAFDQNGNLNPDLDAWLKNGELPKSRIGRVSPRALVFKGFARVQQNDFFKNGLLEIQDEGSQAMSRYALDPNSVAHFLSPVPQVQKIMGETDAWKNTLPPLTVVDACSGAGGKTLALADFMDGKGRIFAYDIYQSKVRALKDRMERAQERNVKGVHLPEGDIAPLSEFKETADIVLVDAPCTGLGVLRRNPDIKWNRKPPSVKDAAAELSIEDLQKNVLEAYAPLVKSGGRLVFGVCTFAKSESVDQVNYILEKHPEFTLESSGFLGPFDTDGFFMASFRKN